MIEQIADLVKNKQIEGLRYVRDESDREGMRIALGLKRDQIAGVIIEMTRLYQGQSQYIETLSTMCESPSL